MGKSSAECILDSESSAARPNCRAMIEGMQVVGVRLVVSPCRHGRMLRLHSRCTW